MIALGTLASACTDDTTNVTTMDMAVGTTADLSHGGGGTGDMAHHD